MTINWKFIAAREGNRVLFGYVPNPQTSNSGVTIATGVDLGQMSQQEIRNFMLPNYMVEKLLPYAGLKKLDAVNFLLEHPLRLTPIEAADLDEVVMYRHVKTIKNIYNMTGTWFDNLPDEAQTVIASVAYQYGDLPRKCPKFWKAVTAQDWKAAVHELRNFGDDYETRRNIEADLLERIV